MYNHLNKRQLLREELSSYVLINSLSGVTRPDLQFCPSLTGPFGLVCQLFNLNAIGLVVIKLGKWIMYVFSLCFSVFSDLSFGFYGNLNYHRLLSSFSKV